MIEIHLPPLRRAQRRHRAARRALPRRPRRRSATRRATRCSRHAWPGNVRELKNAIERAALLAAGRVDHAGAARPARSQCSAGAHARRAEPRRRRRRARRGGRHGRAARRRRSASRARRSIAAWSATACRRSSREPRRRRNAAQRAAVAGLNSLRLRLALALVLVAAGDARGARRADALAAAGAVGLAGARDRRRSSLAPAPGSVGRVALTALPSCCRSRFARRDAADAAADAAAARARRHRSQLPRRRLQPVDREPRRRRARRARRPPQRARRGAARAAPAPASSASCCSTRWCRTRPSRLLLSDDGGRVAYANLAARQLLGNGRSLEGADFAALLGDAPAALRSCLRGRQRQHVLGADRARRGDLPLLAPALSPPGPRARPAPAAPDDARAVAPGSGDVEARHPRHEPRALQLAGADLVARAHRRRARPARRRANGCPASSRRSASARATCTNSSTAMQRSPSCRRRGRRRSSGQPFVAALATHTRFRVDGALPDGAGLLRCRRRSSRC